MNGEAIRNALDDAVNDLARLSVNLPNERLPKEEQFRCVLYHAFRMRGMQAYAQARYEIGQRCTCDLLVVDEVLHQTWIELKVVGSWNSPDVHTRRWNETCERLTRLCREEETQKIFLLLHFLDPNRAPTLGNAAERLLGGPTWTSRQVNMQWRDMNLAASILEYDLNA